MKWKVPVDGFYRYMYICLSGHLTWCMFLNYVFTSVISRFFKRVTYQWGPCLAPKLEMYLGFGMENICSVVCDCWAFLEVLCILRVLTPALRCLEPELPQILFCSTYRFSSVMALVLLAPPQPFLMCTAVLHTPLFCTLKLQLILYWALPLACVTK